MFSFAGMPPTVGFIGKFFVFNAALSSQLYSLVVIGVIGSTISLFYYLRIVVRMYMSEPVKVAVPLTPTRSLVITGVLAVAIALTILLGTVLPGPAMKLMMSTSQEVAEHEGSGHNKKVQDNK
jgi:NADH-quinone oxidoreductase subunit N